MSDVVNKNVQENEKLLILPMIFRSDPNYGDPIFHWNLKSIQTIYFQNNHLDFERFQKIISENKINWTLIFPLTGSWEEDLFKQVDSKTNPGGYKFSAGYLLKVDSYWNSEQE